MKDVEVVNNYLQRCFLGIYKMTEMMLDNDFHKDDLLDVMIECVYPALIGLKQNNVEILGNIKVGQPMKNLQIIIIT